MKLDCEIVLDLLPLFYDEVCSRVSREAVAEHLNICPKCRREWQLLSEAVVEKQQIARDVDTVKAVSGAWKRKRRIRISKGLAVTLTLVLLWWMLFCAPYTRWGVGTTVQLWEKQLTVYAQDLLEKESNDRDSAWQYTVRSDPNAESVFFYKRAFLYDVYEGFFYSAHGVPVGFGGLDGEFTPEGAGWILRVADEDHWMYTEQLVGNWFWFEVHFV